MALNPYFLHGASSEQRLLQDLVNEQLRMFGQEIVYMPRKFITEKTIIKELLVSQFNDGFYLEAYISTADGFGGQGDILSKFGVRSTDEITFIISKERYEDFISPFILTGSDVKLAIRPQEGDLIYLPLDNSLFEIKYVEGKRPFYQLNNLYVYELKCELFEYEDEIISTGVDEIDTNLKDFGYMVTLYMVPNSAFSANINVQVSPQIDRSVSYIDITDGGYGYTDIPEIRIDKSPQGISATAKAVAQLKIKNNTSYIDKILITNSGFGYTVSPNITVKSNSGSGFIGTCVLESGVLSPINIISSGSGYSSPPEISISPPTYGVTAIATASINSSGEIISIDYINAGSGYTSPPTITIQSPIGVSTGNYIFNEIVEGNSSGTNAYVKDWDSDSRILKVSIISGNFINGENIVGSAATYKLFNVEKYDLYDQFESNKEIEEESDTILDFSESNPFGEF